MAKDDRVEGADVPVCVHGGSGVQHLPQPVVIGLLLNLKNSFLASHLRGILNVLLVRLQGKETLTAHNHLYFRKVY